MTIVENRTYSVSSVKDYRNCGYKFYLSRVKKQKGIQKGHSGWMGSLVHEALYFSIAEASEVRDTSGRKKKVFTPTGKFNPQAARDYFRCVWDQEILDDEVGPKPSIFYPKKAIAGLNTTDQQVLEARWRSEAEKMLENGLAFLSDKRVVELEREIRIVYAGRKFLGYIDLICENPDGSLHFYDFKTTWNRTSANELAKDLQFLIYSIALGRTLCSIDGEAFYPSGGLVHLRSGAVVPYTITEEAYLREQAELKQDFYDIEIAEHFPAKLGNPLCPYCNFYEVCYSKPVDLNALTKS